MQHEQTGLPDTSYKETPLLGDESIDNLYKESRFRQKLKKAVDMIKGRYPRADFEKIKIRRGSGKNKDEIVAVGSKKGEYKILKDDGSGLLQKFLNSFQDKLGPRAEEIIAEDCEPIQEQRQRVAEAKKQQREAETIAAEREKELQEMERLRQQTKKIQASIYALQSEYGSNLKSETELRRLKQLKKK